AIAQSATGAGEDLRPARRPRPRGWRPARRQRRRDPPPQARQACDRAGNHLPGSEAGRGAGGTPTAAVLRERPSYFVSGRFRGALDRLRTWGYDADMDFSHIITVDPGKRSGQPCIRGMRITVRDVL